MRKRRGFSGNAAPSGVRWLLKTMPWPCNFENILGGIHITVGNVPTERTDMGSHRQTLLHDLATFEALLRGEARIDSNNCVPGSLSLFTQDVEECAPTGVHNALRQGMVLHHVENLKLLNGNHLVLFSVLFGGLILEIAPLTGNLEMRLRCTLRSLTVAMTAFLTTAYRALLASQGALRGAIEAWVRNGMALAIGQEGLQAYVNANSRMSAVIWLMFRSRFGFTHDEGIPMSISTVYQMNLLGSSLNGTVQLDL